MFWDFIKFCSIYFIIYIFFYCQIFIYAFCVWTLFQINLPWKIIFSKNVISYLKSVYASLTIKKIILFIINFLKYFYNNAIINFKKNSSLLMRELFEFLDYNKIDYDKIIDFFNWDGNLNWTFIMMLSIFLFIFFYIFMGIVWFTRIKRNILKYEHRLILNLFLSATLCVMTFLFFTFLWCIFYNLK